MEHPDIHLLAFAEGTLDPALVPQLEAHLHSCAECADTFADLQRAFASLDRGRPDMSKAYFSTVVPSVRARIEGSSSPRRHSVVPALSRLFAPIAAGALTVLLLIALSDTETLNGLDSLSPGSLYEYVTTYDVAERYAGTSMGGLQESYFVSGPAVVTNLPPGMAEISPVELSGMVEGYSDEEIELMVSKLSERMTL